jgi:hypothetical protein
MHRYRHTQAGWLIIVVTLALAGVFVLMNRSLLSSGPGLHPLMIFPVLLLLFGTLTVIVENGMLRARFGVGLIGKTIQLSQVKSLGAVRNSWAIGWGIRFFPGGVLYNVSGLDAVELRLLNGRAYRIGTDEPQALEAAIRAEIGEKQPLDSMAPLACSKTSNTLKSIVGVALALSLIALIGFIVCMMILEPKPPQDAVTANMLTVRSFLYKVEVPISDITALSLEPSFPCVLRRTNGFSAAGILRGHFDVRSLGNGMLFVDAQHPPYLTVRAARGFVIIGFNDPRQTRALEAKIQSARSLLKPAVHP